jgi:hypothetical protein
VLHSQADVSRIAPHELSGAAFSFVGNGVLLCVVMLSAPLQFAGDNLRILQHLFYGLPHGGLDSTRADSPATWQSIMVRSAATPVVTAVALGIALPGHRAATLPTAETGVTQKLLVLAIASAHLRIVLHAYLRGRKRIPIDDRWYRNR